MKLLRNLLLLCALGLSLISAGSIIYNKKYAAHVNNELQDKTETLFSGLIYDESNVVSNAFVAIIASKGFINSAAILFGLSDDWIEFELIAYTKTLYNDNGTPVIVSNQGSGKVFVGMAVDMHDYSLTGSKEFLKYQSVALINLLNNKALTE